MRLDPTGARVLIVGDSLSIEGGPLDVLARTMEARGASVRTLAVRGRSVLSAPSRFFGRYDAVLVALGTNDHGHPRRLLARAAEGLLERVGAACAGPVLWIGPPSVLDGEMDFRLRNVDRWLREIVGDRCYVSMRSITEGMSPDGRTRDGVHFTRAGARWVSGALESVLLPPVGEDPPPPRARLVLPPGPVAMLATGFLSLVINRRVRLDMERKEGRDV